MHTLVLNMPPGPELPSLSDLLRDWLQRSELGDEVVEFQEDVSHQQGVAVISKGDRRVELRLTHAKDELWRLDAVTWLVHAGPSGAWTALVGAVVFCGGLAVSFGYLGWSAFTFWVGVAASALMAALLTLVARRQERRHRLTPIEAGPHAQELLEQLVPAIRGDRRVRGVEPAGE